MKQSTLAWIFFGSGILLLIIDALSYIGSYRLITPLGWSVYGFAGGLVVSGIILLFVKIGRR